MDTTQPDLEKLICTRNTPDKIPDRKYQNKAIKLMGTLRYFANYAFYILSSYIP